MPALTIADLLNAKQDIDHIAEVATSPEMTATDRLGNTKLTLTGVLEALSGATDPELVTIGIFHTGQSLAEGGVGGDSVSDVTTAERPYHALMLTGGPVGVGTATINAPLVGSKEPARVTIASSMMRAALDLDVNPARQFVFTGQAYGGMNYAALKKGGSTGVYEKIIAQITAIQAIRPGVPFKYMTVIHGEQDGLDNNASYQANLAEWLSDFNADVKAITGQAEDITMLLCQTSSASGYNKVGGITETNFPTPLAQLAAHSGNVRTYLVGPKYHLPYYDHSHITNAGQRKHGEYYAKVIKRLEAGQSWSPVRPTTFNIVGSTVVIDFAVPATPLVFDTTLVNAATNYGFAYTDAAGRTITGVSITGPAQVTVALSGVPGANAVIGYAHHNGDSPGGAAVQVAGNGARGNLRDSDTTTSIYDDSPLYNWCVHFRQALN